MEGEEGKPEKKEGRCSYHQCDYKGELERCDHCGEYYCKEHLNPKPPGTPKFKSTSKEDLEFMEKWREDGHPCVPYGREWRKQRKDKEKGKSFKKALDKTKKQREERKATATPSRSTSSYKGEKTEKGPSPLIIILMAAIALGALLYFFYHPGAEITTTDEVERCEDGAVYGECSSDKPYYCKNGTLIERPEICGCPPDHELKDGECQEIKRCEDGTRYGKCSTEKPLYCENGSLIEKPSLCGCPEETTLKNDTCVSIYLLNSTNRTLDYTLRGEEEQISFEVYKELAEHLSNISRWYTCDPECPTDREIQLRFIDHEKQEEQLKGLAEKIQQETENKDDQARIAISLTQKIPYDHSVVVMGTNRYPYEVIYDNKGLCGEKSRLLAFLIREIGYGTSLLRYEEENHMSVGVKCPSQYGGYEHENTTYCFIESTAPTIPTYDDGEYVGVGELESEPNIIHISNGTSFESISEEYEDAEEWKRLNELSEERGGILPPQEYNKWIDLRDKYGIET